MILIPEIETVLILVPRAASRSLRAAVADRYPKSICLYRHMEADGVPAGYDRWTKVGVVRHPVERLWSLYKFLRDFAGDYEPAYVAQQRASVDMPFEQWLIENQVPFTNPYDAGGGLKTWPFYNVLHSLPENRKSQFVYLRPDLGTQICPFGRLDDLCLMLGIELCNSHATDHVAMPALSSEAADLMWNVFAWDFSMTVGI